MGLNKLETNDEARQGLENLSADEIIDRYKDKVLDKGKAAEYLRVTNTRNMEEGDDFKKFGLFENVSKGELSAEIVRFLAEVNENIGFVENSLLDDLPTEVALAYVAYFQELNGLTVDGIIGNETLSKARKLLDVRHVSWQKLNKEKETFVAESKDMRRELMSEILPGVKGRIVSLDEIREKKLRMDFKSQNRRVENKIPKLIDKYQMLVDKGTPEARARAEKEMAKLENLEKILKSEDVAESFKEGKVNVSDVAVLMGIELPEDLENIE